jgi:AraC-like DNA-binding protein
MIRKRQGFEGQRAIVLPKRIMEVCAHTPPVNSLYVTDIGFYPRAKFHYRDRQAGIAQNILIYCQDGKGCLRIPSGTFKVAPNEYFIVPADMPHTYWADETAPWTIYWAHFRGTHAASFASLLSKEYKSFVNYAGFIEERIRLFDAIYQNFESGYSLDNLIFSSASFAYFLTSLSFFEKFTTAMHKVDRDLVDISIRYMQEHLESMVTLESLASSVNLSVSHFSSIFKKKTGYSPIVYFNHLKIQHACQYLQFTSLRVNEISEKLGIDDPYYFSRMFAKIMGVSPVEYRNKKKH